MHLLDLLLLTAQMTDEHVQARLRAHHQRMEATPPRRLTWHDR